MLDWDEGDVVAVFEAAPEVDDDRTEYAFAAESDGVTVRLLVWPYYREIAVELHVGDAGAVFDSGAVPCDRLVRRRDRRGEVLEAWNRGVHVLVIMRRPRVRVALVSPPPSADHP